MQPASPESAASCIDSTCCSGLFCRGGGWRLTRRGWMVVVLLLFLLTAAFAHWIHPFLAISDPIRAKELVVEGWASDYALQAAVREFRQGEYATIYVTGGPMEQGMPLSEYQTFAALGAAVLHCFGMPTSDVEVVPAPKVKRDRTYASALALRDWFEVHGGVPAALNVITIGPHARRTRLLYERAFGSKCEIGVISIEVEDYDPCRWWAYSQGVRTVISETVAYVYVRIFFRLSADRRVQ